MYNKGNIIARIFIYLTGIICFIVTLEGHLFGQVSDYNLEKVEFRGQVKSILMSSYRAENYFEEIKKGNKCDGNWSTNMGMEDVARLVKIDKFGNIIKDTRYDSNYCVFFSDDLTYDSHNNVTEIKRSASNDSICEIPFYKRSKRHLFFKNSYNEFYQLVKSVCIVDETPYSECLYNYDSIGNLQKKIHINYKRDTDYNPTMGRTQLNNYITTTDTSLYKFNKNGFLIAYKHWLEDGSYKYNYDGKGNRIEKTSIRKGERTGLVTYKYNQEGDITEVCTYSGNGHLSRKNRFGYEYDSKNNWIKRIEYQKDMPAFIIERNIEYW